MPKKYIYEIDAIKAYAIVCVVLVHAFDYHFLQSIFSEVYIGQEVELFLIIIGYHAASSRSQQKVDTHYSARSLLKLWNRILLPFLAVIILEMAYMRMAWDYEISTLLEQLVTKGGWGPGSYFPWLYIQAWAILPLVAYLWNKFGHLKWLSLSVFSGCVALEYIAYLIEMPDWLFRLTAIRFLFYIYLGFSFAKHNNALSCLYAALGLCAGIFILIETQVGFVLSPPLFPDFAGINAVGAIYSGLFFLILFRISKFIPPTLRFPITLIGKSSYHIFLIQMVFFMFIYYRIYEPLEAHFNSHIAKGLQVMIAIAFCVPAGMAWYALSQVQFGRLLRKNSVEAS